MKNLFSLLFILLSINASAQYYNNVVITDVNFFIVNSDANKSIRAADAETLKKNMVREVKIKNSEGKITRQLLVNQMGYIETYAIFDDVTELLQQEYRFGYDPDNNLVSCTVKGDEISLSHTLTYENGMLASVDVDSLGYLTKYNIARDSSGRILKATLLNQEGWELQKYIYRYHSENLVEEITNEENSTAYYTFIYQKNRMKYYLPFSNVDEYEFKDDRITKEERTFPLKSYLSRKPLNIKITKKYFYKKNGLIDYIKITESNKRTTKEIYEYGYFD